MAVSAIRDRPCLARPLDVCGRVALAGVLGEQRGVRLHQAVEVAGAATRPDGHRDLPSATTSVPQGAGLDEETRASSGGMKRSAQLRSAQWYGGDDRNAYIHRAWMRRGVPDRRVHGRPQIAIANTASDLTPCNSHLSEVAAAVRNGVYEAGGVPLDLPVVSLGETQVRPTAMLWRNMAAMATEEMLRANPIDGVVLLGGCDKTIPSLLMAAASVDLPAVVVPGGPMLTGTFRGEPLGCGTDVWRLSEEVRAGTLSQEEFAASESAMIRSRGPLQHDGHRLDDGAAWPRRSGRSLPGVGRHPRAGQPAARGRPRHRPAGRRAGRRRSPAEHVAHEGVVPQRDRRAGRDRRVHQRGRAPAGDRRAARHRR